MDDNKPGIVIDNGEGYIKAGFAGDDLPRSVFPPIVGRPEPSQSRRVGAALKDCYVGDEARVVHDILRPRRQVPIDRGVVTDWDDMEKVWHHTFYNELRVKPEEHHVMLTEPPTAPKDQRHKTAQVMFETFHCPGLYVSLQPPLALYASGEVTGVVVDAGEGATHVVPVNEGTPLPHATHTLPLGGRDLTAYLRTLLAERGHTLATRAERERARDIKEQACYVALDFQQETQKFNNAHPKEAGAKAGKKEEERFDLPDGQSIRVASERFRCPEALFQPSLLLQAGGGAGMVDEGEGSSRGLHQLVHKAIAQCETDVYTDLYASIVLAGGSTHFPGMADRLEKELEALRPHNTRVKVKVTAPQDRKLSVWIGGSLLVSMPQFQQQWVTRQEYEEHGPEIVLKKCY